MLAGRTPLPSLPLTAQSTFGGSLRNEPSHALHTPRTASHANSSGQLVPSRALHRRVVSAGSLPSLDQIAEWSLRRQNTSAAVSNEQLSNVAPANVDVTEEGNLAQTRQSPEAIVSVYIPPQKRGVGAGTSRVSYVRNLARTPPPSIQVSPLLTAVSPAATPQHPQQHLKPGAPEDDKRVKCARVMVNVLEKRKSLTTPTTPNYGVVA